MALTTIHGNILYPNWAIMLAQFNAAISFEQLLNGNYRFAVIVRAPKAGTIEKIHFRTNTVSGSQTLRAAIESLSATGIPSNTTTHYRDVTVATSNTWYTSGIVSDNGTDGGAKKTVSAGDVFAIVFSIQSWVSGSIQMSIIFGTNTFFLNSGTVYTSTNSGSSWAAQTDDSPCIALEYTGGEVVFINNTTPIASATTANVGNGSTPDEYALRITSPVPLRAIGVFIQGDGTEIEALLYDSGGSVVGGPVGALITDGTDANLRFYYFSTPVEITKDVAYRIAWRPSGATTRQLYVMTLDSAPLRAGLGGTTVLLSTRTDGGSWTDDATQIITAGYIVDAYEAGAAGGGGCSYGALINGTRVVPAAQ